MSGIDEEIEQGHVQGGEQGRVSDGGQVLGSAGVSESVSGVASGNASDNAGDLGAAAVSEEISGEQSGNIGAEAGNPENPEKPEEEEPKKPFSELMDWANSIVCAMIAMLVCNLFIFRSITVSGPSMEDTLTDQQKVLVTNFFYTPEYGDIVVVQADRLQIKETGMFGEPIIKRVIAKAGDTIMIDFDKGEVYLNGELLHEDYIKELTHMRNPGWMESGKVYTVPEDSIFIMGDNRRVSNDSRNLTDVGFVDVDMIMGKAFVMYSPFSEFKWL